MTNSDSYYISTQLSKMDLDMIYRFLKESYWAKGIPKKTVQKSMENSICFGAFDRQNKQVGFARAITDKATFGYLADVFVLSSHRGQGISKQLVAAYIEHPDLRGLRRHMLATSDAHKLYAQYGFKKLDRPEIWMQLHNPEVYKG